LVQPVTVPVQFEAPVQVCPVGEPQSTDCPQLLVVVPHWTLPHVVALESATHVQVADAATHDWLDAQAVQVVVSAHPWLASVGTHNPLHCFSPAPQLPIAHVSLMQTVVAPATGGHAVQPVAAQPKLGSVTDTHLPPQSL
jgi:hypothetical protein